MNSKLIILPLLFLAAACSKVDQNSFSLLCSGTQTVDTLVFGKSKDISSKTITLNFKNKQLDNYDCDVWDNEKIVCVLSDLKKDNLLHSLITIDRVGGLISTSELKRLQNEKNQSTSATSYTFEGKCEKVVEKKF
jgi:hypothetical protein